MKDELIAKLNKQINAWNKEVESAMADAQNDKATEDLKMEKKKKQQELKAKIDRAKNKISELKEASEDKITQIKNDISSWFS